jgi:HSP20 family protein
MNVINWSPFQELDDMLSRYRSQLSVSGNGDSGGAATDWRPIADISETDTEFVIKAELPDVDRKDVHVSVENGRVTIMGERSMDEEETDATQHRIESFYGTFSRSFSLPENVDAQKITAKSDNGVLKVRLPKTKVSESSTVEIPVK